MFNAKFMVVTELRNAVVDTIEFIIPPIVKLVIVLLVAKYITYGNSNLFLSDAISNQLQSIEIEEIKTAIDGLYLSGVVPILAILLLITLAYTINRSISFVGTLVPIHYHTISTLKDKNQTLAIWLYFPEIQTVVDLDHKVKELYISAESTNSSLPFDQMKWQEEELQKLFRKITFTNFLFLWSIVSFVFVSDYCALTIPSGRLWFTLFALLILIIVFYFQVSKKEVDIEFTRLMIVSRFLKADPDYSVKKDMDASVRKELEKRFDFVSARNKRWWWLSVGYRLDWLMMFESYRLRFPFYSFYEQWKLKRKS